MVHDPSLLEDLRPLTIDVHLPDIHLGLDAEMGGRNLWAELMMVHGGGRSLFGRFEEQSGSDEKVIDEVLVWHLPRQQALRYGLPLRALERDLGAVDRQHRRLPHLHLPLHRNHRVSRRKCRPFVVT